MGGAEEGEGRVYSLIEFDSEKPEEVRYKCELGNAAAFLDSFLLSLKPFLLAETDFTMELRPIEYRRVDIVFARQDGGEINSEALLKAVRSAKKACKEASVDRLQDMEGLMRQVIERYAAEKKITLPESVPAVEASVEIVANSQRKAPAAFYFNAGCFFNDDEN